MQKALIHIRAVLSRILWIGVSIQIVFGLLWMCCSFTGAQWFLESSFYVKVSENFICDEYTGILYPLLLVLTGKNDLLLCLLQLTAAFGAGYVFVGALGANSPAWRIWGSLGIMTYPTALQCHMAVLPNSLTFSCFLLLLACVLRALKKERQNWRMELLGTHVCWGLAAFLQPEYFWFGLVPVIMFWIYDVVKYRKSAGRRVGYHFLLAAVFAGMIINVSGFYTQEGYYGKAGGSLAGTVFRRVVWCGLAQYYMDWPEEVRAVVPAELFTETLERPENMTLLLQPEIEAQLGMQRATEFYWDISGLVLKNNYRRIAYEVGWDTLGNLLPLVTIQEQLEGRGYGSYCARNYETMRQECPTLTYYFMQYAIWWFPVGCILAAMVILMDLMSKSKKQIYPVMVCVLSGIVMAMWYVMTDVGAWDYKNGLFMGCLWVIWMIVMTVKGMEEQ